MKTDGVPSTPFAMPALHVPLDARRELVRRPRPRGRRACRRRLPRPAARGREPRDGTGPRIGNRACAKTHPPPSAETASAPRRPFARADGSAQREIAIHIPEGIAVPAPQLHDDQLQRGCRDIRSRRRRGSSLAPIHARVIFADVHRHESPRRFCSLARMGTQPWTLVFC